MALTEPVIVSGEMSETSGSYESLTVAVRSGGQQVRTWKTDHVKIDL